MKDLLNKANLKVVNVPIDFKVTLEKHLTENEELCLDCGGTGMLVSDNKFGIRGISGFPFKVEALRFCPSCYSGVRKRCEHCKELVQKGWTKCECHREIERKQKVIERWGNVKKIPLEQALEKYVFLYVDDLDEYVDCDGFDCWLERQQDEDETFDLKELKIYVTSESKISLDANSVIENALEDLHEDAEVSDKATEELQLFLDNWCERYGRGTKTYDYDYTLGVEVE